MLRLADILEATGGTLLSKGSAEFSAISIDSRTIKQGELFLAIKGDKFDGHDFVEHVLKNNEGALVSRKWADSSRELSGKTVIGVDDTLKALHDLARFIRNKFRGPVIAVVGSNGKTTTKELISSVLGTRFKVLKTEGNLNNHIGMPLCIARADDSTEAMVLEMGTNRPGDVALLCSIASPEIGVITNIGFEHLEGFGSLEAVRDAELEILPHIKTVVLNGDDQFLLDGVRANFKGAVTTFGIENRDCNVKAQDIAISDSGVRFIVSFPTGSMTVDSRLSGRFNIYNSLASCAAAHILGFDIDKIKKGLEAFGGVRMRFEIRRLGGTTYLYDVYNANPSSVKASINELARMAMDSRRTEKSAKGRTIAVLGDMLELGAYAESAHDEVGTKLAELKVDCFIGVGPLMARAVSQFRKAGMSGIWKESAADAGRELANIIGKGDFVLIKGSRGMKMENVMEMIEEKISDEEIAVSEEGKR